MRVTVSPSARDMRHGEPHRQPLQNPKPPIRRRAPRSHPPRGFGRGRRRLGVEGLLGGLGHGRVPGEVEKES